MWFLLACTTPETPPAARISAAEHATLASVAELGSYRLGAEITRTWTTRTGQQRTEQQSSELRWEDPDQWAFELQREGRVVQRAILYGGRPWTALGDGPLTRQEDPEPYRVSLSGAWDPWHQALDQVKEQIELTELRNDVWEGRGVVVFGVAPRQLSEKARPTWKVSEATGEVWIDQLSSVRLKGEMRVKAVGKQEDLEIQFQFQISSVGQAAEIQDPALEEGARMDAPRHFSEMPRAERPPPPRPRPSER